MSTDRSKPYLPDSLKACSTQRSAAEYKKVIEAYNVLTNPRYHSDEYGTWCNLFVSDVTYALGVEIPHKITPPPPQKFFYTSANMLYDWLADAAHGWTLIKYAEASKAANAGLPTVATWKNPAGRSGHIAMVAPGPGVTICQAGKDNLMYTPLTQGFGSIVPLFYTHP